MQREWRFKNSLLEPAKINELSKTLGISYTFSSVLLNRGIDTPKKFREYISKSLENIHNPMLLPDIETAVERIKKAVDGKEKITVYGDYDVDGITSTAILYKFLKSIGADADYYIPDRQKDGYGVNVMAVSRIAKGGTKLLITVDCGITSVGEVELAKSLKMDVIITDHHTCPKKIPQAVAVIDPKRPDSEYPFPSLAGVGVAFKLILAIAMSYGMNTKECFNKYVSFAAIGTVADVVDLTGENRIIVDRGLKLLPLLDSPGIKELINICGMQDKPINSTAVAFMISPRINAAGRMEDAKKALELLLEEDKLKAYQEAHELDIINADRQKTEIKIFNQAIEMLAIDKDFSKKRVIVLAREGWHNGVIGIVASRICERFYKPCILISLKDGKGKGSGRSVEGIDLYDALSACEEHLTQFGGHSLAAGLSLLEEDIEAFSAAINKYVADNIKEEPKKMIDIDCSVSPSFLTEENAAVLDRFEPYGMANEKPVFALNGAEVTRVRAMGVNGKHLRLEIKAGEKYLEAVGFSMGDYERYLAPGSVIDIAFNLEINTFMGTNKVQLLIKDIRKR